MKMSEKWLSDRIAYIQGLKNPSLTQKLLLSFTTSLNMSAHQQTQNT